MRPDRSDECRDASRRSLVISLDRGLGALVPCFDFGRGLLRLRDAAAWAHWARPARWGVLQVARGCELERCLGELGRWLIRWLRWLSRRVLFCRRWGRISEDNEDVSGITLYLNDIAHLNCLWCEIYSVWSICILDLTIAGKKKLMRK